MVAKKKKSKKSKKKSVKKNNKKDNTNEKLIGALSYVFSIGLIVLLIEKKNKFMKFHAKQGTALLIIYLIPTLNFIGFLIGIYGFINALMGKEVKIPIVYDVGDWIAGIIGNK